MDNPKTIAMYGPSISDPSKVVNRDVPVCDLQAYKAAGYVVGSIVESVPDDLHADGTPKATYTLAEAIAQNEGKDESTEAKQKAKRKK